MFDILLFIRNFAPDFGKSDAFDDVHKHVLHLKDVITKH